MNTINAVNHIQFLLHGALAAAQCIVIVPVWVGSCVCGSVTTITRNCVHRSSPNWVCSDHLQLIKFWPSATLGRGLRWGENF